MSMRAIVVSSAALLVLTLYSSSMAQQPTASPSPETEHPELTALPASVLDADLKSARGTPFKLSDYSGKVLVINLWATWVAPSRTQTPHLVQLQSDLWSQGVRVIGLSVETPKVSAAEVRTFVRNYGIQYKIGWTTPEVAQTLMQGSELIPQTYVISSTGRLVKRFVGFNSQITPALLKEAIEEALRDGSHSPETPSLSSSIETQQRSATLEIPAKPAPLTTLPASVLDAELKTSRGRSFKLSDYSGKVLVINLWATWCGPCRLETPKLVKLQRQFRAQGVVVVGLSTEDPDNSTSEVRDWVRDFRVNYRIGWSTATVAGTLMNGRDALPQTYVVSGSGRIVRRFVGFNQEITPSQWKLAIQEALNDRDSLPEED